MNVDAWTDRGRGEGGVLTSTVEIMAGFGTLFFAIMVVLLTRFQRPNRAYNS